jgi:hypothetical protein
LIRPAWKEISLAFMLSAAFETPTVAGLAEYIEAIQWATQDETAPTGAEDTEYVEGAL